MKPIPSIVFVSILCVTFIITAAQGHSGATGIIKERMDAMKAMGDDSKAVADMFKGKTEFNRDIVAKAAKSFVTHGSAMLEQFPDTPESRTGSMTEALPRIWEDWDDFSRRAKRFVELSEVFRDSLSVTGDPDEIESAYSRVANSCRTCHKRYRKPKK